jgi:SAM-dependent methyltransferase
MTGILRRAGAGAGGQKLGLAAVGGWAIVADLEFRTDLYQGAAQDYDRFRVPYPSALIEDLARRTGAAGTGRLLDLACGTGQITFALHDHFAEVWAVDQEPDMTATVQAKARAAGITSIRALTCAAQDLAAPDQSFDLVAMGNAFHRLPRVSVAAHALRWLKPGGHLALLWGGGPGVDDVPVNAVPWQHTLRAVRERWLERAGTGDRVPAGYAGDRRDRPDEVILRQAGFQLTGRYDFALSHEWTPGTLTGYLYSTSTMSRAALGPLGPEFEADLRRELLACEPSGRLRHTIQFSYDLARRPVG